MITEDFFDKGTQVQTTALLQGSYVTLEKSSAS